MCKGYPPKTHTHFLRLGSLVAVLQNQKGTARNMGFPNFETNPEQEPLCRMVVYEWKSGYQDHKQPVFCVYLHLCLPQILIIFLGLRGKQKGRHLEQSLNFQMRSVSPVRLGWPCWTRGLSKETGEIFRPAERTLQSLSSYAHRV